MSKPNKVIFKWTLWTTGYDIIVWSIALLTVQFLPKFLHLAVTVLIKLGSNPSFSVAINKWLLLLFLYLILNWHFHQWNYVIHRAVQWLKTQSDKYVHN